MKPVIIAIVARAIWGLCRTALKNRYYALLGAGALVMALVGVDVLVLLFSAGALAATVDWVCPTEAAILPRSALGLRDHGHDDRAAGRTYTSHPNIRKRRDSLQPAGRSSRFS